MVYLGTLFSLQNTCMNKKKKDIPTRFENTYPYNGSKDKCFCIKLKIYIYIEKIYDTFVYRL